MKQNKKNYKKKFQDENKNKSIINMNIDYYEFTFMKLNVIIKRKKKFFKKKSQKIKTSNVIIVIYQITSHEIVTNAT